MRRGFWLRFAEVILRPLLLLFTRRTWLGQENIPASGPAILVTNHLSFFDALVVAHYVYDRPRELRVLAKHSLFTAPLLGTILRSSGQIPVFRATRDASLAVEAAIARIKAGEAPLIYPEGTLTKDPELWPMQGKTGVARLFLATGAPVIPLAQWGAQRFHDPRTGRIRLCPRTPVVVSAGPPVDLSRFAGLPPTGPVLRQITEVIMLRLREDVAALRGEPAPTGPLYSPPVVHPPRPRASREVGDPTGDPLDSDEAIA